MILDEKGELKWSGPSFIHALDWLRDRDQMECQVIAEDTEYRLDFTYIPN